MKSSYSIVIYSTLATVLGAVFLAEFFDLAQNLFGALWIAAASIHTLGALYVISVTNKQSPELSPASYKWPQWYAYIPTVVVLGGSLLLVAFTHSSSPKTVAGSAVPAEQWAFVIWVPIVEELCYRGGFGRIFRKKAGLLWGAWYSSLLFALVHAHPTLSNISALNIGIPLGPFLLGLCAEFILLSSGKILPAITFHMACNATVVVFTIGDSRWLKWLEVLYI